MAYTLEERETVFRTDAQMDHWDVESRQRKFITKIKKVKGCVVISEETTEEGTIIAGRYLIPVKAISIRKLQFERGSEDKNSIDDEVDDEDAEELPEQE
ncbi:MAG: hypothetical protein GT601_05870 [Acidaminobacter sp.]|uniref:hypothetical protein n=1 Tax=Acidaminobacter sp. TaxID=1872102 RepID=UPI0013829C4F|nr:hypothetical protein [Acidaminobacter sp.]MZQ97183.1 hypothetical protein [Acidaminobacter sp.]